MRNLPRQTLGGGLRLALASGAMCLLLASPAAAQDASSQARALFEAGRSAYESGDYERALSSWNEAYSIDPRPLIQFNLSQAYERLGRLGEAVTATEAFLSGASENHSMVPQAQARLAHIRARLSRTGIRFVGGPEGAAVFIDGRDHGRLPRPDAVRIDPGSHQLVIRAEGFADFSSLVAVSAGQTVDIPVQMQPGSSGEAPLATSSTSTGEDAAGSGGGDALPGIILLAVGGALVGGAVGTGIWWVGRNDLVEECNRVGCTNGTDIVGERDAAMGLTIGIGIVGLAGVGVGAALLALSGGEGEGGSAALECRPGMGSVVCAGRF